MKILSLLFVYEGDAMIYVYRIFVCKLFTLFEISIYIDNHASLMLSGICQIDVPILSERFEIAYFSSCQYACYICILKRPAHLTCQLLTSDCARNFCIIFHYTQIYRNIFNKYLRDCKLPTRCLVKLEQLREEFVQRNFSLTYTE